MYSILDPLKVKSQTMHQDPVFNVHHLISMLLQLKANFLIGEIKLVIDFVIQKGMWHCNQKQESRFWVIHIFM